MTPIIFLDFDGCLNHQRDPQNIACAEAPRLDRQHLDVLAEMLEKSGANLVMCSSWRMPPHIDQKPLAWWNARFERLGVPGRFIDTTRPWRGAWSEPRHLQITDWLNEHEHGKYAVIDDEPLAGVGHPWIKPSPLIGLVREEVPILLRFLGIGD